MAMSQAERKLYSYLKNNPAGGVLSDFVYGGPQAITDQPVTSTDPENAGAGEIVDTGVDISAWVSDRRGVWYKITALAKIDQVELTAHKWVRINPCRPAGLITITPAPITNPGGYYGIDALDDGRVFFGQNANPGNVWTWRRDTGLSVIASALARPGGDTHFFADNITDRVYFGEGEPGGGTRMFTWHESTGLSLLVTDDFSGTDNSTEDYGSPSHAIASDGRIFFGTNNTGKSFFTWKEDTGLSILINASAADPGDNHTVIDGSDRVFFGEDDGSGSFWTWHESTGLSTIVSESLSDPGDHTTTVTQDGRVFFSEVSDNLPVSSYHTWKNGILSLIPIGATGIPRPGYESHHVDSTGRLFFGSWDKTPTNTSFYTWHAATGLSTLVSGFEGPGAESSAMAPDGRIYFGSNANPSPFWTWHASTGLTTIITGLDQPGAQGQIGVADDGRIFFGEDSGSSAFWTWHPDTGLSTITNNGGEDVGEYGTHVSANGRVFFGADGIGGAMQTWHKDTGYSILVSGIDAPGRRTTVVLDDGTVFFGQQIGGDTGIVTGNVYAWFPYDECDVRGY